MNDKLRDAALTRTLNLLRQTNQPPAVVAEIEQMEREIAGRADERPWADVDALGAELEHVSRVVGLPGIHLTIAQHVINSKWLRAYVAEQLAQVVAAARAEAWDEGARAATMDYGVGEASNPYRVARTGVATDEPRITRRSHLFMKAMETGVPWYMAMEAVSSTAIEHPEWDMTELKTWEEWEEA